MTAVASHHFTRPWVADCPVGPNIQNLTVYWYRSYTYYIIFVFSGIVDNFLKSAVQQNLAELTQALK